MSAAAKPLDAPNPDEDQVAFHLERIRDKKLSLLLRMESLRWLEQKGIHPPDDEAPGPPSFPPSYAPNGPQGTPRPSFRLVGGNGAARPLDPLSPQDVGAEREILASMALDHAIIPSVLEVLSAEDFFTDVHQALFEIIPVVVSEGRTTDRANLSEALSLRGLTKEALVEGLTAVAGIFATDADPAKARLLALGIRDAATTRRVISQARQLLEDASSRRFSAAELVEHAGTTFAKLSRVESTSTWETPRLEVRVPAVPFPLDVFPADLAALARQTAHCIPRCPADFLAIPCLTVAGAAIGNSLCLKIKDSWTEPANLFTAFIGMPGATKSPVLRIATAPLWKISDELIFEYCLDLETEKEKKRLRDAERKTRGAGAPAPPPEPEKDPDPVKRINVANATCEAIAQQLSTNPRGLIMSLDELAMWVKGMNQYKGGGGDDKQFYLSLWNGADISVDRKGQANGLPIRVRRPFFSLTGPLTPSTLRDMPREDDGLIDRFLFSFPDEVPWSWTWDSIEPGLTERWDTAVRKIWDRPLDFDGFGHAKPGRIGLNAGARKAWEAWIVAHMGETTQSDFPPHLAGPWIKLQAYCARLILIVHQIRWAYGEVRGLDTAEVGASAVEAVIPLIDYFKAHFRLALGCIYGVQSDNRDARDILDWLLARGKPHFKESEAADNFRRRFAEREREDAFPTAIAWLLERKCIRRMEVIRKASGRTPGAAFEINPSLLQNPPKRAPNAPNSEVASGK